MPLFLRKPGGKSVAASLYVRRIKGSVRPVVTGSRLRFDLRIEGSLDLSELSTQMPPRALIRQAERTVARDVRRSFAYGVARRADILNLAVGACRMRSLPWSPLQKIKRETLLALTSSSLRHVRVHLTLVHSAMRAPD